MSIKVRMTLLLGLLLVAFLGVMQFLRKGEAVRLEELRQESVHTSLQTLQQWINLANQPLQRFVRDFSEWPELATYLERRDAAWAEANLHQNLATYEAHALWIAPFAELRGNGGGNNQMDLCGSFVVGSVTSNGHMCFHYDEGLGMPVTTKAWSLALWKELQTAADRNVYRSRLNF